MNEIEKEILNKLKEIEEKEEVRIIHAVESGSRAWGFASPDSDYDIRFIYVRKREDYLRLDEPKDTIEWQLDEVFDMNGWDLKKALIHFHKGNATLFEWGNSPVVYRTTEEWKQIFNRAGEYFSVKAASYHYYGIANSTYCKYLMDETVQYKKYLYAVRPLFACRYIQQFGCAPPVLFDDLLKLDMPRPLRMGMETLLKKKMETNEKEYHPHIPEIQGFISSELEKQKTLAAGLEDDRKTGWELLNRIYREMLML